MNFSVLSYYLKYSINAFSVPSKLLILQVDTPHLNNYRICSIFNSYSIYKPLKNELNEYILDVTTSFNPIQKQLISLNLSIDS